MSEKSFEVSLSIEEELLDTEYRHLHHADALKFLEKGRLAFLDAIELPQDSLLQSDCFLVLSRCEVSFLRELKQEEVICTVEVKSLDSPYGFTLRQALIKAPRRVAVEADIALVAMSSKSRRRTPLPEVLVQALEARLGA